MTRCARRRRASATAWPGARALSRRASRSSGRPSATPPTRPPASGWRSSCTAWTAVAGLRGSCGRRSPPRSTNSSPRRSPRCARHAAACGAPPSWSRGRRSRGTWSPTTCSSSAGSSCTWGASRRWPRARGRRSWPPCRCTSTRCRGAGRTWSRSTTTWRAATRSGWGTCTAGWGSRWGAWTTPSRAPRSAAPRTPATSPTARTTSSASTTCATTWWWRSSSGCSAATSSPSSMRWTPSWWTRRAPRSSSRARWGTRATPSMRSTTAPWSGWSAGRSTW